MSRLWSFPELKYAVADARARPAEDVARELNERYYGGEVVRSAADVNKVRNQRNIFHFEMTKGGGEGDAGE